MARLVIFDESVRGVDLGHHAVILGRSRRADIPIRDRLLSRKHCAILPAGSAAVSSGPGAASGFRVIDLKSSNGTYLNGARIDRHELRFDDIIEIGNTVIVLLDTDAAQRGAYQKGDGLPRLNNPAKARELIRAIRKREIHGRELGAPDASEGRNGAASTRGLRQKKILTPAEKEFLAWARIELASRPALRQVLEAYILHQVATLLVRHSRGPLVTEGSVTEGSVPGGSVTGGSVTGGSVTEGSVPEGSVPGGSAPDLGRVLTAALERILDRQHFEGDLESLRAVVARALDEALALEGRGGAVDECGGRSEGSSGGERHEEGGGRHEAGGGQNEDAP